MYGLQYGVAAEGVLVCDDVSCCTTQVTSKETAKEHCEQRPDLGIWGESVHRVLRFGYSRAPQDRKSEARFGGKSCFVTRRAWMEEAPHADESKMKQHHHV